MLPSTSISDRTTRFVQAALQADAATIQTQLASQHVHISLDASVAHTFAGQAILFTMLNLLVRLNDYCPHLHVVLPVIERHPLLRLLSGERLETALQAFFAPFPAARKLTFTTAPSIRGADELEVWVSPTQRHDTLSVWADGWIIYLNEHAPAGPWDANSVGASVAAGVATAEVFKHLIRGIPLRPGIPVVPLQRLIFSTYDYGLGVRENPPLPSTVSVEGAVVVGLGGIGAGFVAAAASLPALEGQFTLVDKDALDETNLNRHLVSRPGDTGLKVDLCKRALAFHPNIIACPEWFAEFVAAHGGQHDIVIIGVDDDRIRREIQSSRPRLILNAGTSDVASFRVTRHDYVHGACLSCIARGDVQDHPVERELARQLGLDLQTILDYHASGAPLPAEVLRRAGVLSEADIQRLGNRPIAEIQVRVCAQVPLGHGNQEAAVSISFLSALPGFLLLGELIKERAYPDMQRPPLNHQTNHALWAVFGRPHPTLLQGWRDKRTDCDCARPAYQRAYHRKWQD